MIRVIILAAGSAGDVYPFIVIGQALRARGHAVTLVASANFQARVEQAGLRFVSGLSQEDLDASVADPDLWHPIKGFATIWKHMARHLPQAYTQQLALLKAEQQQGPTVIVASTLGLTGRLLQETQGVPLATLHLAPSCFLGARDASVRRGLNWPRALPQPVIRLSMALVERLMLDPIVRPAINRLRASLGLAPVRRVMSHWLHSPQRVICAFPAWFAAPQPDWPPHTVCTAFPRMPPSSQQLAPDLQRFLDAGTAPIVVTPGSAMAHGRHFLARALDAAGELGLRVVVVTPYRSQLPATLPASVLYVAYAPFDLLSRRAAAFVHHGGIGTSATVLAAGKPQLVVPFAFDQPDNAARLRRLGVAATVLPDAPPRAWRAALAGLLGDPAVATACAEIAVRMAQAVPAEQQIADLVTGLVESSRP
ncbi:glycosyltransferase [Janthinobacterium aquaticum]|uniref:glycosyltransferase n=1 Tax=Janthinobacterium sp. FT58W TaxID=2654254 RepID=UPI0012649E30|nr:nucleotide disphospho-sugar-binding domain-containing protein [Janthinobacterium sp. FT58W]KAB8039246.1 glycosyltransferase [Janthinobacterium sp. FT58W]